MSADKLEAPDLIADQVNNEPTRWLPMAPASSSTGAATWTRSPSWAAVAECWNQMPAPETGAGDWRRRLAPDTGAGYWRLIPARLPQGEACAALCKRQAEIDQTWRLAPI